MPNNNILSSSLVGRFVSFVLIFLLFFCLSFLCLSVENTYASSKYGGKLILALTTDPKSFNEITGKDSTTSELTAYLFEGLTRLNPFTLKVEPHLATRWEVSPDGLVWTFFLRKDVLWSDGVTFSAHDVVFTFNNLIYNPDVASSSTDIFTIDGQQFKVKALDDYTVEFKLPFKFAPFLRSMGQAIMPRHKLTLAVKEKKFNFTWGIDADLKEIVGTGPFKLKEYRPGQRVVFERNPRYWKKSKDNESLPFLNQIIYVIVQNSDVELLKFLEGSIDFYSLRGMDYSLLKPLEKKRDFTMYDMGPSTTSNFVVFNLNNENNPQTQKPFVDEKKRRWFSDSSFKQAVAHAVDKAKIIEIVKNGLGYPQYSAVEQSSGFFHNPNVSKYDYNLDKAKRILAQSGFVDRNGDHWIEDPEGNTVEFNLNTNADNNERLDIAAIIRNDLESLGMKINFQPVEFNVLVSKLNSTYDWDAMVMGLTGSLDPHFGKNVWASNGQLHMWHPKQKQPQTAWEKRIDELFSLGVQELDEVKRKELYDEFQLIVSKELPVIYTVLSAKLGALRNKFENIQPSNLGGLFHNLEEIWLKGKVER